MKHYFIILFLTIFSCGQVPKHATLITDDVYLTLPDSIFERYNEVNDIIIYAMINDSIEYHVAVADNKEPVYSDSVKKIEGFDANLFRFSETQEGYNLTSKDSSINGYPALFFNYQSDIKNLKVVSNHQGFLTYHKNHMIIIEFVNRIDLEEIIDEERSDFLNSMKIK